MSQNSSFQLHKENHKSYLSIIIAIFIMPLLFIRELGIMGILALSIVLLACIVFHKITIEIDKKHLKFYFFLGFFKKEIELKNITRDRISVAKTSWITGVGIRYTNEGTLYNVNIGDALKLNDKNKSKTYLIGAKNPESLKKILLERLNNI